MFFTCKLKDELKEKLQPFYSPNFAFKQRWEEKEQICHAAQYQFASEYLITVERLAREHSYNLSPMDNSIARVLQKHLFGTTVLRGSNLHDYIDFLYKMFARTKDNIKALTNRVTFSVRDSPFYFQEVFQVEN
jgi:hypothetical protein